MKGADRRDRRQIELAAWSAKMTGWLAQIDPKKQPSIEKLMGAKTAPRIMRGRDIGRAMRAWAGTTKGR